MEIIRAYSTEDIAPHLENLKKIYIKCFSEFPWLRHIEPKEVETMLKKDILLPRQIFLMGFFETGLVGAALACPVKHQLHIAEFVPVNLREETICFSRIFVSPDFQGNGIGKALHLERLSVAKKEGFKFAAQRTNPDSKMFPLILKSGFKPIAQLEVWLPRKIGNAIVNLPDQRIISFKEL